MVDVIDETVERAQALGETSLDPAPLRSPQDAWDDVKGPLAVDVGTITVDREGDTQCADRMLSRLAAIEQLGTIQAIEELEQRPCRWPCATARSHQLIERRSPGISPPVYVQCCLRHRLKSSSLCLLAFPARTMHNAGSARGWMKPPVSGLPMHHERAQTPRPGLSPVRCAERPPCSGRPDAGTTCPRHRRAG